jgi:hypothetical protein
MSNRHCRIVLAAFASVLSLCNPSFADAGLFRAYLSVHGADTNSCALADPCRLLPAALAAVADGGEVWMLDSGNFNTSQVNIGKSVTILAVPGSLGSLVIPDNGSAVAIDGAGIDVTLRNLVIVNLGRSPSHAILFNQGQQLLVEGCEMSGGVSNNGATAVYVAAGVVTVKNTTLKTFSVGVSIHNNARVAVTDSTIVNSQDGAVAGAGPGFSSSLMVTRVTMSGVDRALRLAANVGGFASIVSDGNTFTYVGTVYWFDKAGGTEVIWTRQNNTTGFYGSLITPGGSLSVLNPT